MQKTLRILSIAIITNWFLTAPLFAQVQYNWSFKLGNTGNDQTTSVCTDGANNFYVTGFYEKTIDFDPGTGDQTFSAPHGYPYAVIAKYDADSNLIWAQQFLRAHSWSGTIDHDGNFIVAGNFDSTIMFNSGIVLNPSPPPYLANDIFIAKFDSAGNNLWAFSLTGQGGADKVNAITTDKNGNIIATGMFSDSSDFDPGPGVAFLVSFTQTSIPNLDAFVAKYDANGNYLWSFSLGVSPSVRIDAGKSVAADPSGNIYVGGDFNSDSVDFDPGPGSTLLHDANGIGFIAEYSSEGDYIWAFNVDAVITSITLEGTLLYATGTFNSDTVDFDPGLGVADLSGHISGNVFLAKYDLGGNYQWAFQIGTTSLTANASTTTYFLSHDADGNIYLSGMFSGTGDFDPGPGTENLFSAYAAFFIAQYDKDANLIWAMMTETVQPGLDMNAYASTVDGMGNVYLVGSFSHAIDFDPGIGQAILTSSGGQTSPGDGFIAQYHSSTATAFQNISLTEETELSIYPNPNDGIFSLHVNGVSDDEMIQVTVMNSLGEIIFERRIRASDFVVMPKAAKGIYQLQLRVKTETVTKKFVIAEN